MIFFGPPNVTLGWAASSRATHPTQTVRLGLSFSLDYVATTPTHTACMLGPVWNIDGLSGSTGEDQAQPKSTCSITPTYIPCHTLFIYFPVPCGRFFVVLYEKELLWCSLFAWTLLAFYVTVFFSHNKSANNIFQPGFSTKQIGHFGGHIEHRNKDQLIHTKKSIEAPNFDQKKLKCMAAQIN